MSRAKIKQTFRQRWLPTFKDAAEATGFGPDAPSAELYSVKKYAKTLVCVSAILWGSYQGIGNNLCYSHGERTGMINKVSENGLFWKTSEGQMALEGIVSGHNFVCANVWDFSLDRQARHGEDVKKIAAKLQEYMQAGTKVRVTYTEPLATWPWRSETGYLIQNVEPIVKAEK